MLFSTKSDTTFIVVVGVLSGMVKTVQTCQEKNVLELVTLLKFTKY